MAPGSRPGPLISGAGALVPDAEMAQANGNSSGGQRMSLIDELGPHLLKGADFFHSDSA